MNLKTRPFALVLALVMLVSCFTVIPTQAAEIESVTHFSDVADHDTATAIESLQLLGVLDGYSDGTFRPNVTLNRAQFCKMAVYALNCQEQAKQYRLYTIFPDVKPDHWAAGYINMAAKGKNIIAGFSNGYFSPNQQLTYGQAVTILMRMLGYEDKDVGAVWPDSYLLEAANIGLTDGLHLTGNAKLSRGDAALLFANLLAADMKEGDSYASSIASQVVKDQVLLSSSEKGANGKINSMKLSNGQKYCMSNKLGNGLLNGCKGTLLLDKDGRVMTFVPTSTGTFKTITIAMAKEDGVTDSRGTFYPIDSKTVAYVNDDESTYGAEVNALNNGRRVTLYFDTAGMVDHLFIGSSAVTRASMVIAERGSTEGLSALAGTNNYSIMKNGIKATSSDLREYDVAIYDAVTNTIRVNDTRLTGYYESCAPSTKNPETITVLGHTFDVMPSVDLSEFRIGQQITLLLTEDDQVAGVTDAVGTAARGNAVGIASVSGGTAKVQLLNGLEVSGDLSSSDRGDEWDGQLVRVSSSGKGKINLSVLSGSNSYNLNVKDEKLGSKKLADNVVIYEQVRNFLGCSKLTPVSLDQIPDATVSYKDITYVSYDWKGRPTLIIMEDVTGNCYTYGKAIFRKTTEEDDDGHKGEKHELSVQTDNGTFGPYTRGYSYNGGEFIGVAESVNGQAAGVVQLEKLEDVPYTAWSGHDLVMANGTPYKVAEDVGCFNQATNSFVSFSEAKSFGSRANLYVDEHHIVRIIEVDK